MTIRVLTLIVVFASLLFSNITKQNSLIIAINEEPYTLDTTKAKDSDAVALTFPLNNTLFRFEDKGVVKSTNLVKSYSVEKSGKLYKIVLNSGVHFHKNDIFDGDELTAKDVVYSLSRALVPNYQFYEKKAKYLSALIEDNEEYIKEVDKYTIEIGLKKRDRHFLEKLASSFASIYSLKYATLLKSMGKENLIDSKPIGLGSFKFLKRDKNKIIYERVNHSDKNVNYLVFKVIAEEKSRVMALKSKEVDVITGVYENDLENLEKRYIEKSSPYYSLAYLAFNTSKKPFDDKNMRLSISSNINKLKISKMFSKNSMVANFLVPEYMKNYHVISKFDFAKKEYKKPIKLSYCKNFRPYMPDSEKVAILIKADLDRVGYKIELQPMEMSAYLAAIYSGNYELALFGWNAEIPIVENLLVVRFGEYMGRPNIKNISRFQNNIYDGYLTSLALSDDSSASRIYKEMEALILKEKPVFPLMFSAPTMVYNKNVDGIKLYYGNLYIYEDAKKLR